VAMIDRVLAPQPAPVASDAMVTKKEQDRADGMAAYARGLVFAEQGAWEEAEKEFHTTEQTEQEMTVALHYLEAIHRQVQEIHERQAVAGK